MSFHRIGEQELEETLVPSFSFGIRGSATPRSTLRLPRLEVSEAGSVLVLLFEGDFVLVFDV